MNKTTKYITAAVLFVTAINGACAQSSDSANDGVWDKTKEVSSDVWDGTKEVSSDVWDGAKKVTGDVWDGAKEVGSDIKDGLDGSDNQNTDKNNSKQSNQ